METRHCPTTGVYKVRYRGKGKEYQEARTSKDKDKVREKVWKLTICGWIIKYAIADKETRYNKETWGTQREFPLIPNPTKNYIVLLEPRDDLCKHFPRQFIERQQSKIQQKNSAATYIYVDGADFHQWRINASIYTIRPRQHPKTIQGPCHAAFQQRLGWH